MDGHSMYTRATHDLSRSNMWLIQLSMLLVIVYMLMPIDHDFIETNNFFFLTKENYLSNSKL